jgi:hypothetical protein
VIEVVRFECGDELTAVLDRLPGRGDTQHFKRRKRNVTARPSVTTLIHTDRLASETDIPRETAAAFLDAFVAATTRALKSGDQLSLLGFGSFSISKRSARTGRNP